MVHIALDCVRHNVVGHNAMRRGVSICREVVRQCVHYGDNVEPSDSHASNELTRSHGRRHTQDHGRGQLEPP